MSSISKTRAVHFLFLCFFAESALKHSNLSPSQGKDFRTAPTLALLTWWQITKYVAWKQLEHVLCLAELIDSNTTIGIWRIWEGIRGLTGVYEKQSGARDSSCFQETKHPRQVHRKPCSPLLLSTQSLEGVVWISETQRKYSWLFPHIHITTGIILGTQLHTHNKSEIMREESATQTQPFQTPRSGFTTSVAAQDWKIRIQNCVLMGNQ